MPAQVTFEAVSGPLAGQKFTFDERTTCILGRASDCGLQLAAEGAQRTISRHHCLLDINPPDVRIRDFGSRNGTYVNGRKIGQRDSLYPGSAKRMALPQVDLEDGDEIRLGKTAVLRVRIRIPVYCPQCSAELPLPAGTALPAVSSEIACLACGHVIRPRRPKTGKMPPPLPSRVCAKCGRDVSNEQGDRPGEYVCQQCRADPLALMKQMLESASSGEEHLVAIEGYDIVKELGRGGMGAVYLARHSCPARNVALKVMLPQMAAAPKATAQFLREIEMTKVLVHPHIVRLYGSGCHQGTFFITLEYCNGGSVDRLMHTRGGRLPIDEAMPIILQVLDGLSYAHEVELKDVMLKDGKKGSVHGLVHRDLKPANIFLNVRPSGVLAKVGDYGLAKAFDLAGLSGHTCADAVGGTPQFLPRQQVLRFKYAKPEVDVWAAAASLYNMLTGKHPREFHKEEDPWLTVLQAAAVPIRTRVREIPERLACVIDEALIDDPKIRIKSAQELKQRLEEAWR